MLTSNEFRLWDKGRPLNRALFFLSHKDKAQRLRRLDVLCSNGAYMRRMLRQADTMSLKSMASDHMLGPVKERDDLRKQIEHRFLFRLVHGHFVGYGFTAPQLPESIPVRVPAYLWSGAVDWQKSSVERRRLKMVDIRVLESTENETADFAIRGEGNSVGRPSVALLVETAIYELDDLGEIDLSLPYKASYEAIRCWLKAQNFNSKVTQNGISDSALVTLANPILRELRKQAKRF